MRLIDADALKKFLQEKVNEIVKEIGWYDHYVTGLDYAITHIEDAPTIDAEPVRRGRWEPCANGIMLGCTAYRCSMCGRIEEENSEPYCHCGAKMDTRLDHPRGCATCANDGMDMPQCRECIEHLERPWYRPKDGGAE